MALITAHLSFLGRTLFMSEAVGPDYSRLESIKQIFMSLVTMMNFYLQLCMAIHLPIFWQIQGSSICLCPWQKQFPSPVLTNKSDWLLQQTFLIAFDTVKEDTSERVSGSTQWRSAWWQIIISFCSQFLLMCPMGKRQLLFRTLFKLQRSILTRVLSAVAKKI